MRIRWRTFTTFAACARWSRMECCTTARRCGRAWVSSLNAVSKLFHCLLQRCLVCDVETFLCAVDLAHQAAQHFPRPDFHESLDSLGDQHSHGLIPLYGSGDLADQSITAAVCVIEQSCVDVADEARVRFVESDRRKIRG